MTLYNNMCWTQITHTLGLNHNQSDSIFFGRVVGLRTYCSCNVTDIRDQAWHSAKHNSIAPCVRSSGSSLAVIQTFCARAVLLDMSQCLLTYRLFPTNLQHQVCLFCLKHKSHLAAQLSHWWDGGLRNAQRSRPKCSWCMEVHLYLVRRHKKKVPHTTAGKPQGTWDQASAPGFITRLLLLLAAQERNITQSVNHVYTL